MDYKISDSTIREIPRALRAAENSRYGPGSREMFLLIRGEEVVVGLKGRDQPHPPPGNLPPPTPTEGEN